MKRFVLGVMVVIGGVAVYRALVPETPEQYYLRYQALIADGRSFEEDAAFHAAARRAEIQAQLAAMGEDAERLKTAYLDMTAEQAGCSDLTLAEETRTETSARLVFDVTDTCGTYGEGVTIKEIIELVAEDGGWKILSNETSVSE